MWLLHGYGSGAEKAQHTAALQRAVVYHHYSSTYLLIKREISPGTHTEILHLDTITWKSSSVKLKRKEIVGNKIVKLTLELWTIKKRSKQSTKSFLWGNASEVAPLEQRVLRDLCGRNRVSMREVGCTGCILAISPCSSLVTTMLGLQIRQKSPTEGDKLQKLFLPSLPRSAKHLLKHAVHLEAKLELATYSFLPWSWVLLQSLSLEKQPPIFPPCSHVSLLCCTKRVDEWSSSSPQNKHLITDYSYTVAFHQRHWSPAARTDGLGWRSKDLKQMLNFVEA